MSIETILRQRSDNRCELCSADTNLSVYAIPPDNDGSADQAILLCCHCHSQLEKNTDLDLNHWRCLNESMWSQVPAVQVMAWRQLTRLSAESWAQDALDMLYLEEDALAWAKAGADDDREPTRDSNGAILQVGDTVTIIKDLDVKGTGFTAKRGTAVRGISLTDNPEHIEGRVNGTRVVLLSKFLKKSN